jgi:hypothetical protein
MLRFLKLAHNVQVLAKKGNLKTVSPIRTQMYCSITKNPVLSSAPFLPIPFSYVLEFVLELVAD